MSMSVVKFKVIGISALLTHNPASMRSGSEKKMGTKKIPTPELEAVAGEYKTKDGRFYLPTIAFRSAVVGPGGGATFQKIGKRSAVSCASAGFFVIGEEAILIHPKTGKPLKDYVVDSRRAVVQKNGVLRSRPRFDEWACELVCEVDDDFIRPDQVLELLNLAGRLAGVGDYRPQKRGPFGRFRAELVAS